MLGRLDVIALNAHTQGSLNGIERYDQGALAAARDQNAFDTGQGAAANPYPLADFQKGVRR